MIDRSHSPISSLNDQDQALYTARGGHLGFLCTEGVGGHCGLHLHRPWPLKYTVNLTLAGSKMAVHNTKCSIKKIIRKIGDCEQSTLRLLFMRFEVQSIQLLVTKNSNLWPGQSQLKAINSFVS